MRAQVQTRRLEAVGNLFLRLHRSLGERDQRESDPVVEQNRLPGGVLGVRQQTAVRFVETEDREDAQVLGCFEEHDIREGAGSDIGAGEAECKPQPFVREAAADEVSG